MEMVLVVVVGVAVVVLFARMGGRRGSCPECKGAVHPDAKVCQHCGYQAPEAT